MTKQEAFKKARSINLYDAWVSESMAVHPDPDVGVYENFSVHAGVCVAAACSSYEECFTEIEAMNPEALRREKISELRDAADALENNNGERL